jgi:hypothetical protein
MPTYYVDDGGSATDPYDTWAKAATSLSQLDDAKSLASGDIVYIGHDHVCQYVHAANRTITGPTSGLPCVIISATQGSNPPTYQASTTNQIDTSEGAYNITFDGCFSLYGVRIKSGQQIIAGPDSNETCLFVNCTFAPGANNYVGFGGFGGQNRAINCTYDLTADGTTVRTGHFIGDGGQGSLCEIIGGTVTNPGYRTGVLVFCSQPNKFELSGFDFSGFNNGTTPAIASSSNVGKLVFANCLTAATWLPVQSSARNSLEVLFHNCGSADAATGLLHYTRNGDASSSAAIYRAGGASVEGEATAWLITTQSGCNTYEPYKSPYIYGLVSSTGSKTFDLYITNDTADFDDSQVWLEVEYLGTADEAQWSLASDQRADITTTAATQTDDTSSTWNGSGPAFTYKQKLSVTATVNETGQYRARVCVGVASIASSRYFYVDPKVTVS